MDEIVIDACLALHFIIPTHSYHPHARRFFIDYARSALIAPPLFVPEADSNLRYITKLGKYTVESSEALHATLYALPVTTEHNFTVRERAWDLADIIGAICAYDCTYAALVEAHGCEFWTAEKKFYNVAHRHLPFVKFVGVIEIRKKVRLHKSTFTPPADMAPHL